jgi:hypothetical protein
LLARVSVGWVYLLSSSFSFPELLVGFPWAHPLLLPLFTQVVHGPCRATPKPRKWSRRQGYFHTSAWNRNSANFALTEFSEVRINAHRTGAAPCSWNFLQKVPNLAHLCDTPGTYYVVVGGEGLDGGLRPIPEVDGGGNRTSYQLHVSLGPPVPDTTSPEIQIFSPAQGATCTVGQAVKAAYICTDGESFPSCEAPVANGAKIDTSSAGSKTFTVTAIDEAGNTSSVTHTYTVNAQPTSCTKTGTSAAETLTGTSGPTSCAA